MWHVSELEHVPISDLRSFIGHARLDDIRS